MKVSVVIPCYYSEATIGKVVTLTREALVQGGFEYEFVLVNDGSTDGTFSEIEKLVEADRNIVGVNCAKNLGQHSAIMAGLRLATGEFTMVMDDDMQTHPSQCLKILNKIKNSDYDVVFAEWEEHKESWWRRLGSKFATWTMCFLTNRPKEIYSSNFFAMRDHIRQEIIKYSGPYVYIQGLLFRATANMANVDVEHFEREQGSSGYTMKSLVRLWSNILNFSLLPLRAAAVMGVILGILGFVGAIVIAIMRLTDPTMQTGWPSLMATLLFCSGVVVFFLGIIGEYLGRLFMTVNCSPQYVLKKVIDNRTTDSDESNN